LYSYPCGASSLKFLHVAVTQGFYPIQTSRSDPHCRPLRPSRIPLYPLLVPTHLLNNTACMREAPLSPYTLLYCRGLHNSVVERFIQHIPHFRPLVPSLIPVHHSYHRPLSSIHPLVNARWGMESRVRLVLPPTMWMAARQGYREFYLWRNVLYVGVGCFRSSESNITNHKEFRGLLPGRPEGGAAGHVTQIPPSQYLKTVLGGSRPTPQHLKIVPGGSRPPP
jgi:hypothetical protein